MLLRYSWSKVPYMTRHDSKKMKNVTRASFCSSSPISLLITKAIFYTSLGRSKVDALWAGW